MIHLIMSVERKDLHSMIMESAGQRKMRQSQIIDDNRCEDAMNIANGEEGKKNLIDSLTFFKTEGRILYPKEGVANIQDIIDNLDTKTGRVTIKSTGAAEQTGLGVVPRKGWMYHAGADKLVGDSQLELTGKLL